MRNNGRSSSTPQNMNPFINARTDIKSLIHAINLLGDNLVGVEVGINQADSFCTILENCPSVKELHGIDQWLPYKDLLKNPYDGTPAYTVDARAIEIIKHVALTNIKYSTYSGKARIYEGDSKTIVKSFENNYFDFAFIDSYLSYEQTVSDLEDWYTKVKPGGIFSGHDYDIEVVEQAVTEFRCKNNITATLSIFDNTWAWKK